MSDNEESSARESDVQSTEQAPDAVGERERTFSRRMLIQAGWVTPLVVAMALPSRAAAASGHVDTVGFFDDPGGFCDGLPADHCDIILAAG